MKKINTIITMLLFSISVFSQTTPYVTTTGTQTLSNKTYLSGTNTGTTTALMLKINSSNLPSGETSSFQLGADKMLMGNKSSALNTPTFIEFLKSDGAGSFATMRGSMGYLGASEMNLSVNMDYTTGSHKYYDATKVAVWSYLGNTNGFGVQYVPANNTNSNIYANYGCRPFYMEYINQPATGRGIDGFSKLYFQQLSFTDANNTATTTVTSGLLQQDGGILKLTGSTGMDFRLTHANGYVNYNSNAGTGVDLNLMTPFTLNAGGTSINALSYSTTVGYKEGIRGTCEDGLVNIGVTGKAVKTKANGTNIGLMGVASNTNATTPKQIGGFFGLTGIADALPASLTSAALMADNGTSTDNILTLRDNSTIVFEVIDGGKVVLGNTIRLKGYTVATLPAGTQGDKAFVTDALTPTYNAIVVGGGAVVCEVFYNGTNWITN